MGRRRMPMDETWWVRALAMMLLLMTIVAGCQTMTGRSAGRVVDDSTITAQVKAKLVAEKPTNLTRVGVHTVNGVVHLEGVVDTPEQRARAEEIAGQVKGVRQVVNVLQTTQPAASPR
jgi:hyperosmotically inducible periplasmic protein